MCDWKWCCHKAKLTLIAFSLFKCFCTQKMHFSKRNKRHRCRSCLFNSICFLIDTDSMMVLATMFTISLSISHWIDIRFRLWKLHRFLTSFQVDEWKIQFISSWFDSFVFLREHFVCICFLFEFFFFDSMNEIASCTFKLFDRWKNSAEKYKIDMSSFDYKIIKVIDLCVRRVMKENFGEISFIRFFRSIFKSFLLNQSTSRHFLFLNPIFPHYDFIVHMFNEDKTAI